MRCLSILILLLIGNDCTAQKRKDLRCPTARRTVTTYTPPMDLYSFKFEAGFRHPFTYSNPDGNIGDNYRTIARPNVYIAVGFYHALSQPWGIAISALATQTRQGLNFAYYTSGQGISASIYQGSFQTRIPVQLTYARPGWKAYFGTALVFNSFSSAQQTTGHGQAGDATSFVSYDVKWNSLASYTSWDMGMDGALEKRIKGNLSFNINAGIDFYSSALSEGWATVDVSSADIRSYHAITSPYLWYAGIGLSYKVFRRVGDN